MTRPLVVFVFRGFRDALFTAADESSVVQCYGGIDRFSEFFSGHAAYRDWMSGQRFLGVWGDRNCSRFRRLLTEWSGSIDVAHCKPPAGPHGTVAHAKRLGRAGREALETQIKVDWTSRP